LVVKGERGEAGVGERFAKVGGDQERLRDSVSRSGSPQLAKYAQQACWLLASLGAALR
jgi:hypothetical protein